MNESDERLQRLHSRQYVANVKRSLDRLQRAAQGLPLAIAFDWTALQYVVAAPPRPRAELDECAALARGRFQIAATYINGFAAGLLMGHIVAGERAE